MNKQICFWFLFPFIILMLFTGCKQKRETKYDNGKTKEVFYVYKSSSGKEIKNGASTSFYENGLKMTESLYKDDQLIGLQTKWYPNGIKQAESNYENGILSGIFLSWYNNGSKKLECAYKGGKLNGKYVSWYENGKKAIECVYTDSIINGHYCSWAENGDKNIECTYKQGTLDSMIFNSDITNLAITIASPNPDVELLPGYVLVSDALNSNIKNAKAYIDKKKGIVVISFDYPSQAFINSKTMIRPTTFTIRFFDKFDKYLTSFTTENQVPEAFYSYSQESKDWYDACRQPPNLLKRRNNVIMYSLSASVVAYAKSVEMGYTCFKQVLSRDCISPPPY